MGHRPHRPPLPDTEELTGEHLTAEVTNVVDCAPEPTPPPTAPPPTAPPPTAPAPSPTRPPGTAAGALPAAGTPALPSLLGGAAATALGGTILVLIAVRRRSRR
ncbi:hypothetical protein ACFV4P_14245 [Kitasatospora sp. NPDC059795]|uniref:hypothetical protein n=1 Tax=Kitasatospora sp. NPDC059795 TaxID=3346949 RepID=UPI00364B1071